MNITTRTYRRFLRRAALVLAVAAVAAPAAQAELSDELSTGGPAGANQCASLPAFLVANCTQETGGISAAEAVSPLAPTQGTTRISTAEAVNPLVPAREAEGSTPVALPKPSQEPVLAVRSDTFDFGDAGIGAGIGAAIALLLAGATLAARKRRPPVGA